MLSDLIQPRVPEVGKIKIGTVGEERKSRSGGTWRAPVKLDRFLVTHCDRDANGRFRIDEPLMRALIERHGEPPDAAGKRPLRAIPIYLLSDDVEEVLRARWVRYEGRQCAEACDGRRHEVRMADGRRLDVPVVRPCTGRAEDHPSERGWKLHGNLACVIAEGQARFGGVYVFRTTSQISLSQLYGSLLTVSALTGGILVGVPLRLVVRGMQVSPQGKTTTVYVVHVELAGVDVTEVQRTALAAATYRAQHHTQIRAAQAQYAALVAHVGDEDEDEVAAIVEEYHPPQAEPEPDPLAALRTPAVVPGPEMERESRPEEETLARWAEESEAYHEESDDGI